MESEKIIRIKEWISKERYTLVLIAGNLKSKSRLVLI